MNTRSISRITLPSGVMEIEVETVGTMAIVYVRTPPINNQHEIMVTRRFAAGTLLGLKALGMKYTLHMNASEVPFVESIVSEFYTGPEAAASFVKKLAADMAE